MLVALCKICRLKAIPLCALVLQTDFQQQRLRETLFKVLSADVVRLYAQLLIGINRRQRPKRVTELLRRALFSRDQFTDYQAQSFAAYSAEEDSDTVDLVMQ